MRFPAATAVSLALACGLAFGQAAQTPLVFEAASVKPSPGPPNALLSMRGGPGTPDPGRLDYRNAALKLVIQIAYDVEPDQVSGPAWLSSARFDIQATLPQGATKQQFREMLQNLLTERFHLAFHREKKDFSVYELQIAKSGPKLRRPEPNDDAAPSSSGGRGGGAVDKEGFPLPPLHQTAQRTVNGVAQMAGNQITLEAFAQFLRFPMSTIDGPGIGVNASRVIDKTGLEGEYDIHLQYQWPRPAGFAPGAPPGQPDDTPDGAPTIFNALQQQLGLRLEKTRQSLDVLIVDQVERTPVEN